MIRLLLLAALFTQALPAQKDAAERARWNRPVAPFRIVGNIYYVGVEGISSFLIATPEGHILIDGGFAETAATIEKNIATLRYKIRDVKYLLSSHAHGDHAGGLAELKRATGASMIASAADGRVLSTGLQTDFGPGNDFPGVKIDRTIAEGDTVQHGGAVLTAHLTPGHTRGCTTWTMPVVENGKTYNVLFSCSTSVPGYRLVGNTNYPNIADDYAATFAKLRKLPCDVFLGPHPSFFHMEEKLAKSNQGGPNPFIDPKEFPAYLAESERDFRAEWQRQKK